ncbi:hypothetical protein H6F98_01755 [Microcoleus sp. FACHB-SPT15]|uniref:hypothetical protein n=1 Tax=Microcoleus sp. FACHB-SPT15 TaxID=2692830 RepID=UPI00177B4436|nr:hypothetical protein [Microcoleus sp. FACHB-SPT15]MBD1804200.1 hypothetical protein [Microcoleus sp. FACHB-SPT15]
MRIKIRLLQEVYSLQQSLGQNAGRQTWLAQERSQTPHPVIVKLLAFSALLSLSPEQTLKALHRGSCGIGT